MTEKYINVILKPAIATSAQGSVTAPTSSHVSHQHHETLHTILMRHLSVRMAGAVSSYRLCFLSFMFFCEVLILNHNKHHSTVADCSLLIFNSQLSFQFTPTIAILSTRCKYFHLVDNILT